MLTVGRLVRRKGVLYFTSQVLPQIVAQRRDVHYVVVGDGPERSTIQEEIRRQGLQEKVTLLGRVDEGTLWALYRAADLFVMPNIPVDNDMEGFGLVALEASTAECCVVASRLEGITDAVKEGKNGFLIEPGHTAGYVRTILQLLGDTPGRKAFGREAKLFTLAHYSWEKTAKEYLDIFQEIIGGQEEV